MLVTGINDEKCIKCRECVKECPSDLYISPPTKTGEHRKVLFENPYNRCNGCGHCVSICPTDAIIYEKGDPAYEFEGVGKPESIVDYETVVKILRTRRSIRRYKPDPVSKEDLEAVLEAMRYAPSASNMQSWEYIVLNTPESIEKLRQGVINLMKLAKKALKLVKYIKPIIPKSLKDRALDPGTKIGLDNFFIDLENGKDPVFYNAPAVIITYAPAYGHMAGNDAGIALTYGMLAAQARGLGTCWIGFAQEALLRNKKLRKWFKIPKHTSVNGVFILGCPAVKYKRVPPREPLKVKWI